MLVVFCQEVFKRLYAANFWMTCLYDSLLQLPVLQEMSVTLRKLFSEKYCRGIRSAGAPQQDVF